MTSHSFHWHLHFWIRVHHGHVDDLLGLVRWIQSGLALCLIRTLGESIPMVSLRTDEIATFETEFIGPLGSVRDDGTLIVRVLAAKIVHVIQRLNTPSGIDYALLHHFVGDAADLRGGGRTSVRLSLAFTFAYL